MKQRTQEPNRVDSQDHFTHVIDLSNDPELSCNVGQIQMKFTRVE